MPSGTRGGPVTIASTGNLSPGTLSTDVLTLAGTWSWERPAAPTPRLSWRWPSRYDCPTWPERDRAGAQVEAVQADSGKVAVPCLGVVLAISRATTLSMVPLATVGVLAGWQWAVVLPKFNLPSETVTPPVKPLVPLRARLLVALFWWIARSLLAGVRSPLIATPEDASKILTETTGKQRDRVYAYKGYLVLTGEPE